MAAILRVQFKGNLKELKEWLAEMPDNLASAFHTQFEASTTPPNTVKAYNINAGPEMLQRAYDVAASWMWKGQKISAIKEVRNITGAGLKEAKDFVEGNFLTPASAGLPTL